MARSLWSFSVTWSKGAIRRNYPLHSKGICRHSNVDCGVKNTTVTMTWRWPWVSCQIRKIVGCACTGNTGSAFPRHRLQKKSLVSDPGMHHGTCVTHVPCCMSRSLTHDDGENVPGIPGACATRNFTYLSGERPILTTDDNLFCCMIIRNFSFQESLRILERETRLLMAFSKECFELEKAYVMRHGVECGVPTIKRDINYFCRETRSSMGNLTNAFKEFHTKLTKWVSHRRYTAVMTSIWWRHGIETRSMLLTVCVGNTPVISGFLSQRVNIADLGNKKLSFR